MPPTKASVTLIAALAIVAAACGGGSSASPTPVATPSPLPISTKLPSTATPTAPFIAGDSFRSVYFVDDQTGWVAGTLNGKGVILATADGGQTWKRQYTGGDVSVSDLQFTSSTTGWAEEATKTNAVMLLKTTDGGQSWLAIAKRPWVDRFSLDFISPTLGRAISLAGLEETYDGGQTWTSIATRPDLARSLCFGDANDGWVVASKDIVHTIDGGQTWTTSFKHPENLEYGAYLIWCKGPDIAWSVVMGRADPGNVHTLYRTVDGGNTWAPVEVYGRQGESVQIVDAETVVTLVYTDSGDYVVVSNDAGSSWGPQHEIPAPYTHWGQVSFVDADDGWIAGPTVETSGDQAFILATTDGGKTWTQQYP